MERMMGIESEIELTNRFSESSSIIDGNEA